MSEQTIINSITDTIYQCLFGYNRDEIIRQAKERAGTDWGFLQHGGDEDEMARDWMSIEAIQALDAVEGDITDKLNKLNKLAIPMTLRQVRLLASLVAKPHKVTKIWDER